MAGKSSITAEAAAARAARVKAEKESAEENANWARCPEPRCGMQRRWNGSVLSNHRRYDQNTLTMIPCEGSQKPPVDNQTAPATVFSADQTAPVGAARSTQWPRAAYDSGMMNVLPDESA